MVVVAVASCSRVAEVTLVAVVVVVIVVVVPKRRHLDRLGPQRSGNTGLLNYVFDRIYHL